MPTQAADWMAYIFSDLPPSVKSQLSKQRPVVRLQVRSVGVNDELEENYVVGLLSFSADGSFIRDFESSEVATVRNLRSIDKLTMILKDSHSFQKTFVLKIERRHVSRFDQNREERIKQSPWDGVLYSAYKGKLNPLARVSGQMELLDFEQLHSLMSR